MKHIELLAVGVKLFSVLVLLEAVSSGATALLFLEQGPQGTNDVYLNYQRLSAVFYVALLILSIFMWRFPVSIAKWFMPKSTDERYASIDLNVQGLEIVGFSLIGVYILTWAIPDLIHNVGLLRVLDAGPYTNEIQMGEVKLNTFVTGVEILIGVTLCAFPGNLTKLLVMLRR